MRAAGAADYRSGMSTDHLHGSTWVRTRGDAVAWMRFADGTINGSDGCNLIGGPYREVDGAWRLGPLRSTRRFCHGDAGALGDEMAPALAEGTRLELADDVLVLRTDAATIELRPPAYLHVDIDEGGTVTRRSLAEVLTDATGRYLGSGDGAESGAFLARIEVRPLPGGAVSIDYEATSHTEGLQHEEHSILAIGPDGRDRLYVAHAESPFVTELVASAPGSWRFVQSEPFGPYTLQVVIDLPEPGRLTYAWWWAEAGDEPTEQSKADTRRA
jgi:hypothetical protein